MKTPDELAEAVARALWEDGHPLSRGDSIAETWGALWPDARSDYLDAARTMIAAYERARWSAAFKEPQK